MKFYVETFGCQMNVADGLEMGRRLKARGFEATTDPALADTEGLRYVHRASNLEDVFIKLTGRELRD